MKKFLLIILSLVLILNLVGCEEYTTPPKEGSQQISDSLNGVAEKIANNQKKLEKILPIPEVDYSNNRANIIKRLNTFGSDQNKVSWIYCFTPSGQCVLFTSVKGCVTNLSSYAVPDDQIVDHVTKSNVPNTALVIQSADVDATYGTNGEGIFWYDTEGIYHEWNGLYMLLDQPTKLNIQPLLTINVNTKNN